MLARSAYTILVRSTLISPEGRPLSDNNKKKLIVSRQPIFINLKSNTMKNTVQR